MENQTTQEPEGPARVSAITFAELRAANLDRLPQFKNAKGQPAHSEPNGSDWKLSAWSNALGGEFGEAANLIKKIERGDLTLDEARDALADELADVATYLDILAFRAGVDLGAAIVSKFNFVSQRVRATTRIVESWFDSAAVLPHTAQYGGGSPRSITDESKRIEELENAISAACSMLRSWEKESRADGLKINANAEASLRAELQRVLVGKVDQEPADSVATPIGDYAVTGTTPGTDLIRAERLRQIKVEGFGPERDDRYTESELTRAAKAYLRYAENGDESDALAFYWPDEWSDDWFKPSKSAVRNLTKAGALIAAEIDRLMRAEETGKQDP